MVLKDARGQAKPVAACRGDTILKLLHNSDLRGLSSSLKTYVAPLFGAYGYGKENDAKIELHKLAREFTPFLVQFLKVCGASLASVPISGDAADQGRADELFSAMIVGLDSLNQLRSFLTGCSFEIEIQRYGLVRRLMAWRRFGDALAQSQTLFRSLCHINSLSRANIESVKQTTTAKANRGGSTKKKAAAEDLSPEENEILGSPPLGDHVVGLPTLVVSAVIDLIWCTAEAATDSTNCFEKLLSLPEQLVPWISLLDAGNAVKQRDALFRALYKCTLVVIAQPTRFGTKLLQELCKLTLGYCASSTQRDQYAKVARKFCISLSSVDATSRIAVDICSTALSNIASHDELEGMRRNIEVLELVDWFSRSCQATNQVEFGWHQIYSFVFHKQQVSADIPVAVSGLYGIGLLLVQLDGEQRPAHKIQGSRENSPKQIVSDLESQKGETSFLREACFLLQSLEDVLHCILQLHLTSTLDKSGIEGNFQISPASEKWRNHLSTLQQEGDEFLPRLFLGIARAVQHVQKPAARYAQALWNEYVAGSCCKTTLLDGNFHAHLRKVLKLCHPLIEKGIRCPGLNENDRDILSKGYQVASQVSVAALRLSLLHDDDIEDIVALVIEGIKYLLPEEQWWLMSSTYNMGVQLFNSKQYSSACWPLEVAYKAAWARINSNRRVMEANASLSEMISEACAKCSVFADARNRNGESEVSKLLLIEGVTEWASVQPLASNIQPPRALIKSFIKLMCVDMKPSCFSNGGRKGCSLYGVLGDLQPPLPAETLGMVLEEELAACKSLIEMFPEQTRELETQIFCSLLDNVYTGDTFLVQRSRILLEKSRHSRLIDSGNLPDCIKDISEALCLMEKACKTSGRRARDLSFNRRLKRDMAVASSMMSILSYELDPHSQNFYAYASQTYHTWRDFLDLFENESSLRKYQNSLDTAEQDEQPIVLLLCMMDLLHIQGYSVLQVDLYGLILKVSAYLNQPLSKADWHSFIMNSRMSHVLCPVLFPSEVLSSTRQFYDHGAKPREYWQENVKLCPGSMMEAQLLTVQEDSSCQCGAKEDKYTETDVLHCVQKIKEMTRFNLSDVQKTSHIVLQSAELRHLIADLALQRGDLTEAIKYANEAYQLRLKLFKRIFRGFEKLPAQAVDLNTPSSTQEAEVLVPRNLPASVAASCWPFTVKIQQFLSIPSQWRILGSYVESLMQVGLIYEKMGAADDAERIFREGHRIATAQNLPMVLGWFSSSLGEVYRKRLMWEAAENYLCTAKKTFERLDDSATCKNCISTGKASLEIRIGDLLRHHWFHQQGSSCSPSTPPCGLKIFLAKNLSDAVCCYTTATVTLSESSGGFDMSSFIVEESISSTQSKQRQMLSTLREEGKKVSKKIMAHVVEETAGQSTIRARKPRLRRSVQTRSSALIQIGPDDSHEKDLEALCEDLSLTSLSAEEENFPKPQRRKTRSVLKSGSHGVKHETEGALVSNESVEELISAELPDRTQVMQKPLKLNRELRTMPDVRQGDVMDIAQAAEECNKEEDLRSLSLEEWPCHGWNHLYRKLLARILLQKGKCLVHLGQLTEAGEVYEKAVSTLYARSSSCLRDNSTCSSAPLEEGVLLYHMSRLWLQRNQQDESLRKRLKSSRRGTDELEKHKVEIVDRLYRAFSLCHQFPPVLRKIAKLLAVLYVALPPESPLLKPGLVSSGLEAVEVAAYFHQISLGTTMRQQHLAVLDWKLSQIPLNGQASSQRRLKECVPSMQQVLRILPLSAKNLVVQVKDFLNSVPPLSVCCISFVDEEDLNLIRVPWCPDLESNSGATASLLVTRFFAQSTPVVALLPVGPLHAGEMHVSCSANAGESASNPYYLTDDEETSTSDEDVSTAKVFHRASNKRQRMLQKVAAEFESVLEESRRSTSGTHPVATPEEKSLWWKWRMQLDRRLGALVRTMEVSWLGPHKCLLLGEPKEASAFSAFETVADHLFETLKSIASTKRQAGVKNLNHSLIRSLLKGVGSFTDLELRTAIGKVLGWNDYCYCDTPDANNETVCKNCGSETLEPVKNENLLKVTRLFRAAFYNLYCTSETDVMKVLGGESGGKLTSRKQPKGQTGRKKKSTTEIIPDVVVEDMKTSDVPVKRQPLQLILDSDAQALPWESLPVVREYEVYRMPSLGNVQAIYIQHQSESIVDTQLLQEADETNRPRPAKNDVETSACAIKNLILDQPLEVTFINPCNTFYILNPSGDLKSTQSSFEDWFTHQPGWKGKAGAPPSADEFKRGLQDFDLFVYLGHGTGDQFLPERFVRQLDQCAATLLMGCSSGKLNSRGQYEPFGTVQSYLMAGCPSVIANLWDVTDGDIDRFSKCLLHKWMVLEPESAGEDDINKSFVDLGDCEQAMKEVSNVDDSLIEGSVDMLQPTSKVCPKADATETVRMSSAVGRSRNACRLPYLIGASPVCYGVPTGLRKQAVSKIAGNSTIVNLEQVPVL
ncbi:separase [Marchantia polymorpha subsp. ruderalis]